MTPNQTIADKTRYLHYDNLGSVDTITDGQGNVVDRMSYDAFGQRRAGDWRTRDNLSLPSLTNRGFTGHEHIDEMGLIHMNGRVYDPNIGRFMSADPNIYHPYNTQDYNRYSYTINNPLKYVDPSGYGWLSKIWKKIKRIVKTVAIIVVSSYTGGLALAAGWGATAAGAISGFVGGALSTGSLRGGIRGAIFGAMSAGIANRIGHGGANGSRLFNSDIGTALAHGTTQGAISRIAGGDFRSGFYGGVISSVFK